MPGERCAEHRPRQESLARVGARSGRGTAGGRLARAANDLFALLQDTAIIAGRPGNGAPGPPILPGVVELMGQLSARDHALARVLLRCSYSCDGIAIRDPSSCSTRLSLDGVAPLRADDVIYVT